MTITENLQMGAYIRSDKAGIAEDIEKMFVLFQIGRASCRERV